MSIESVQPVGGGSGALVYARIIVKTVTNNDRAAKAIKTQPKNSRQTYCDAARAKGRLVLGMEVVDDRDREGAGMCVTCLEETGVAAVESEAVSCEVADASAAAALPLSALTPEPSGAAVSGCGLGLGR